MALEPGADKAEWERNLAGLDFKEFNEAIGYPKKDGVPTHIFDYEWELHAALQKHRHVWIKKARGLGVTEFMLRYMAWLCLKDDTYRDAQMAIITGPRLELAVDLIVRMKKLFEGLEVYFDTDKTIIILNGCKIKAYPSNANTSRGQPNMRFIFMDEADFFDPGDQIIAREVAEGYIGKTNPWIVLVSTPNLPGGLYEQIEKDSQSLYHKITMNYERGLGKIYTQADIETAKLSPHFEREYNLQYGSGIGNIFPYDLLNRCVAEYPLAQSGMTQIIAVDPAYGSSKFGLLIVEIRADGLFYVLQAEQFERPSPASMLERIVLYSKQYQNAAVLVDSAHPGLVTDLNGDSIPAQTVNFQKELSEMTMAAAQAVREEKVRIHPTFTDLVYQLRAVTFNQKGHPDKTKISFDLGDAFLMAVKRALAGNIHMFKFNRAR